MYPEPASRTYLACVTSRPDFVRRAPPLLLLPAVLAMETRSIKNQGAKGPKNNSNLPLNSSTSRVVCPTFPSGMSVALTRLPSSRLPEPWFGGGRKVCGLEEWDEEKEILPPGERAGVLAKVAPSAWLTHSARNTLIVGSWRLFVCQVAAEERITLLETKKGNA